MLATASGADTEFHLLVVCFVLNDRQLYSGASVQLYSPALLQLRAAQQKYCNSVSVKQLI